MAGLTRLFEGHVVPMGPKLLLSVELKLLSLVSSLDGDQDRLRRSAATTGRTRGSAAIVHARPNVVQFTT